MGGSSPGVPSWVVEKHHHPFIEIQQQGYLSLRLLIFKLVLFFSLSQHCGKAGLITCIVQVNKLIICRGRGSPYWEPGGCERTTLPPCGHVGKDREHEHRHGTGRTGWQFKSAVFSLEGGSSSPCGPAYSYSSRTNLNVVGIQQLFWTVPVTYYSDSGIKLHIHGYF